MFHSLDHLLGSAYFTLFALASLLCGGGLLLSKHPINGAIYLIGVMLSLSGIYALLGSPFLGVIQVLVYAGAIMMLVVFVIMVLNQARDHRVPRFDGFSIVGAIFPIALAAMVVKTLAFADASTIDPAAVRGEIAPVAATMFDLTPAGPGYYLLFELIGVLLLVAVVAAVMLAKRHLDSPAAPAAPAEGDHAQH
ncbi:MAG: NADH-quinone oxidoreductase subunit J [Planctomycetes bacterium]|nr:NADH-quinone oxidoreductase subunit J [Planctomycetota bacterium]